MAEDRDDDRLVGGRYRLSRLLGRGGMGAVWAAHDELLDREVAVKEISPPPGLDAEQRDVLRERTMREARAAARIRSTAAVTVYDVVEQDGQPWIVMELLPSRTLAHVLREDGPLPPVDAARTGLRLLDALSAAHAAAVLHRDVKPANVMFDARGEAVLTDFGIASLEGDPTMTATGAIIGSPGYVAPERAHGGAPTPASDMWSLGVTLAAAVHGRSPFERDTALATMVAALQEPLPPEVTEGPLGTVLSGLLQKDPAHRLDAGEARRLLEQVVAAGASDTTAPIVPMPPPTPSRPDDGAGDAEHRQALRPLGAGAAGAAAGAAGAAAAAGGRGPGAGRTPTEGVGVTTPPRRRRGLLPLVVAVVALVVGGVVLAALLDGRDDGQVAAPATTAPATGSPAPAPPSPTADETASGAPSTADTAPADDATADDASADEEQDTDDGEGDDAEGEDGEGDGTSGEGDGNSGNGNSGNGNSGEGDEGSGAVPAGFAVHEDDAYTVAVPEGWSVDVESGTRTRFRDPESRRYLLVEEGGAPSGDPVEDWQEQEPSVAQRLDGYELIGIERAEYRDFDAADWQFTWEPGNGTVRVLNRNVVDTDAGQAYALYWQVPVEEWDDSRPVLDDIAASFQPAG